MVNSFNCFCRVNVKQESREATLGTYALNIEFKWG